MDDGTSNSIAESKDSNKEVSSVVSGTQSFLGGRTSPATINTTNELRHAAEQLSNNIASTINTLGATFLATQNTNPRLTGGGGASTSSSTRGQSKGFIDACWVVPEDEEPEITTKTAQDPATFQNGAVPGIKAKLQLDDNSVKEEEELASPVQRIRQQRKENGGDNPEELDPVHEIEAPSSPARRSQGEVVESWKRKMKIAQKKREQEANELLGGGGGVAAADETDNDTKTEDDYSFIRNEDDAIFKEDDEDDHSHFIKACQPGKEDGTMLDPIFSAAMTLEGIPSSRKEFLDLVTGKCRVMIGADDEASTDSDYTDEWSDSYMTPESPRRRRRKQPTRSSRSARKSRGSRGRRDRSRDSERRRHSKSPEKGRSRGGGGKSRKSKNYTADDSASADQSEITMTPERDNKDNSQRRRPATEESSSPQTSRRQHHQRTPPSTDKLHASKSTAPTTNFTSNRPSPESPRRSAIKMTPKKSGSPTKATTKHQTSPKDKNFVKEFIREISQKGYRMMWYRDKSSRNPSTVVLFLQHGHKMNNAEGGSHSGPAMVWLEDSKSKREEDQLFYGVNLFDIRTLERASASLLGPRSFAMPSRSIFLRLAKGNEFIFEAPTEQEAFRFVHGMKWVIARLAFNLVIGNMDVVCELVEVDKNKGEATVARAMDDVTLQMVDKSILKIVK